MTEQATQKKKQDRKGKSVYLDRGLVDLLEAEAEARGFPVKWFTEKLLGEALSRLKPMEEFKLTFDVPVKGETQAPPISRPFEEGDG